MEEFWSLISLAVKISGQPSIDYVLWLSVVTLTEVYNEKEQDQGGKVQNLVWEEKEPQEL